MAHSSSATAAAAAAANATPTPVSISRTPKRGVNFTSCGFHRVLACHQIQEVEHKVAVSRRSVVALSLVAASVLGSDRINANAAARRPPPPPQKKNDPNVSGVMAKVLASKRRKEAMKESMAKLREKGKPVNEPPISSIKEPSQE